MASGAPPVETLRLLALSGSLRAVSSNTAALVAARILCPRGAEILLCQSIGALPHFNPDLDGEGAVPPPPVAEFREQVGGVHGVLFSTPEYAHGLPGSFKNALDWLVSAPAFYGKPVAVINATPGPTTYAADSLVEILKTMGARIVSDAFVELPLRGRKLGGEEIAADPLFRAALCSGLARFIRVIRETALAEPVLPSP